VARPSDILIVHSQHSTRVARASGTEAVAIVTDCTPRSGDMGAGQRPLIHVVLGAGDQWVIEAEWPDGSIEPICTSRHVLKL
jgi:hypothetical protein